MNFEIVRGCWKQVTGWTVEALGRLTNHPPTQVTGRQLVILGKLQVLRGEALGLAHALQLGASLAASSPKPPVIS